MPSTYTVNLGIEKPATGEQSGTWGDTTNINFDILDQAINGAVAITLASAGTSGSPNTLAISDGAVSDGRNKWIEFVDGGDLGATAYVQLTPNDAEKIVFIRNSLSGSRSVILFQGTYDAARDLEVPAGVDMVVKFSGGGATATATDVFTRLRATAIETPSLTATTADINGGTVDGTTIGGATPAAGTFTNLTANTDLTINSTTTVDGILDEDNMASNSATKLATQQSIKAYVDSQVGTVDTLAEILANGNTTGSNNIIVDNGQAITTNTINETTAGSGVTIDSVLLKDDGINATNLEITNIKANDGTAAGSIANSTGAVTITSFISNSVDIGGGAIDDTTIGGTTPNSGAFTTLSASGNLTVDTNTLYVDSSTNKVSIGTTSSDGTLHVHTGSAGTITAAAAANDLVIESDNAAGMSLLFDDTSTNSYGVIYWGNETDGSADGRIEYFGSTYVTSGDRQAMLFRSAAAERLRLQGSAVVVNEPGNDTDFRVESDTNTHALFVDAGNSRVGVNASSPAYALDVSSSAETAIRVNSATGSDTVFRLSQNGTNKWAFFNENSTDAYVIYSNVSTAERARFSSSEVVFNEPSNDYDFRVESDGNTHMLFVDAGADHVAVGGTQSTSNSNLTVNGPDTAVYDPNTLDTGGGLSIFKYTNTNTNNDSVGLAFRITTDSSSSNALGAIRYVQPVYNNFAGRMVFQTRNSNGTYYEQMRLDSESGLLFNSQGDSFLDFSINSDSHAPFFKLDAGNNKLRVGSYQNDDGNTMTVGLSGSQTYPSTSAEGQLAISTVNNAQGNNQHAGLFFRVSSNNGSNNANASIGLKQPDYTSHNSQFYFNLRSQTQNKIRQYALIDSESGWIFNDGSESYMDFRVESDANTHALFVDAGTSGVGIGNTANANAHLSVDGDITGGYGGFIRMNNAGTSGCSGFIGCTDTNWAIGQEKLLIGRAAQGLAPASAYAEIVISGSEVVVNENSNDRDFRVESNNNTHMVFVDAGSDFVAFGNTVANPASGFSAIGGAAYTAGGGMQVANNSSGASLVLGQNFAANGSICDFRKQGTVVGSISVTGSTTTYNTSSDARLKENIADAEDAGAKVDAIQVRQFDWKVDGSHQDYGMVAQELITVAPEAVSKGETEEEMMGVDYSKLVPMLVKEIQSLRVRVHALESK